jgi:predicted RNA-binding Zn ribbon-like protein
MSGYSVTERPEPGERVPAPGRLRLVQAFLNSADVEAGSDELDSAGSVRAWLARNDLPDPQAPIHERDRHRFIALREALRDTLDEESEGVAQARARKVLNREAAGVPLRVSFSDDGATTLDGDATGTVIDRATSRLLAAVVLAVTDGTWDRLKICRNDACRWAFYDGSRNRSGVWCAMSICGNRMKGRAFRHRQASGNASRGINTDRRQRRKVRPQVPSHTT